MNTISTENLEASREKIRGFGRHYDYDVSYIEQLLDASPGAFLAFEAAMPMGTYHNAAPADLLYIAKIAAMRIQDCGPCTELGVKKAREAKVPESVIQGALHGGKGLAPLQLDVYHYAQAVISYEDLPPDLLSRLESALGREVLAELALALVAARLYPTLKHALGHAKSCSLVPSLN